MEDNLRTEAAGLLRPTLTQLMLKTAEIPLFKTGGTKRTISPPDRSDRKWFGLDIFMASVSLKTNVWVKNVPRHSALKHLCQSTKVCKASSKGFAAKHGSERI